MSLPILKYEVIQEIMWIIRYLVVLLIIKCRIIKWGEWMNRIVIRLWINSSIVIQVNWVIRTRIEGIMEWIFNRSRWE